MSNKKKKELPETITIGSDTFYIHCEDGRTIVQHEHFYDWNWHSPDKYPESIKFGIDAECSEKEIKSIIFVYKKAYNQGKRKGMSEVQHEVLSSLGVAEEIEDIKRQISRLKDN